MAEWVNLATALAEATMHPGSKARVGMLKVAKGANSTSKKGRAQKHMLKSLKQNRQSGKPSGTR